jgi:hypothetical protein
MSRTAYPSQEVVTLALSPSIREKLLIAGFRTVRDFGQIQPVQLAKGMHAIVHCATFVSIKALTCSSQRLASQLTTPTRS